uniref:Uncharacterized protein n=1 Tax=Rhizophora mucronata TaxID=61149 RepID=A0A2P2QC08_RHIMU
MEKTVQKRGLAHLWFRSLLKQRADKWFHNYHQASGSQLVLAS